MFVRVFVLSMCEIVGGRVFAPVLESVGLPSLVERKVRLLFAKSVLGRPRVLVFQYVFDEAAAVAVGIVLLLLVLSCLSCITFAWMPVGIHKIVMYSALGTVPMQRQYCQYLARVFNLSINRQ